MAKLRLDNLMAIRGMVSTRSQAESYIKLGKVLVDGKAITKPGYFVRDDAAVTIKAEERYVSRAGLKLASVAKLLKLDFRDKIVLDVGSSTGGFTDYALRHGAAKVVAVDVGTNQLHPSLRGNSRVELYEKTDVRSIRLQEAETQNTKQETGPVLEKAPDIILIDVSFISLREIIPHVSSLMSHDSVLVAMLKPQFEAGRAQVNKGVIKNDTVRRQILKEFEAWVRQSMVIVDKADSDVAGAKGNRERFYLLRLPPATR